MDVSGRRVDDLVVSYGNGRFIAVVSTGRIGVRPCVFLEATALGTQPVHDIPGR